MNHIQQNKEKSAVLIAGYIHQIQRLLKTKIIPHDINDLCQQFYYLDFIIDSLILIENEKYLFQSLLEKHNKNIGNRFELLYRGKKGKECKKAAYGKQNTITLIETDTNNVFGLYTQHKWGSITNTSWAHDKNAFMFLLRSSVNHPPNIFIHNYNYDGSKEYTIQIYFGYLCIFGLNAAIMIGDGGRWGEVNNNTSFTIPGDFHLNGGEKKFVLKQYEVFQCENKQ
eukprot:410629_1